MPILDLIYRVYWYKYSIKQYPDTVGPVLIAITANCESSQTFDLQTYSINTPPLRAICTEAIIAM